MSPACFCVSVIVSFDCVFIFYMSLQIETYHNYSKVISGKGYISVTIYKCVLVSSCFSERKTSSGLCYSARNTLKNINF